MIAENFSDEVLRDGFGNLLNKVLEDNSDPINNIEQVRLVSGWYKEAKNNPNAIRTLIINNAREKLLGLMISHLEGCLTDSISTKIRIHNDEIVQDFEFDYSWKLYVEYVKKVDFVECGKVKVTFGIKVAGKLQNARINWKENPCLLNVDRFVALVTISIANVQVVLAGIPSVNIPSCIKLCRNQLIVIKDLSLNAKVKKSAV
jgi:hypothetical protein